MLTYATLYKMYFYIQIQRFYHNYKNLRAILAFTILLKRSILNATKSISWNDCMSNDEIILKLHIILSFLCKNLKTKNKERHTIFWSFFIFFKQIDLCLVFLQNDKTNLFHNNYLTTMVQTGYVLNLMILIFVLL